MKRFYALRKDRLPFDCGGSELLRFAQAVWCQTHLPMLMILFLFSSHMLLADVHGKNASPSAEFYITSRTPAPGSTGIPLGMTAITITFNENYKTVNGKTVSLKRYDTDGSATTSTFVNQTFATNSFTINFEFTSFLYGKKMYILVEDGAFTDHDNNPFEGISSKDAWTFTIEQDPNYESDPPVITSLYPSNESTDISRTPGLNLEFDEFVYMVSGKEVKVHKYGDDALIKTIVTPESGTYTNQWYLVEQLDVTLDYSTKYYVLMEEGAFKDEWENLTPAISNKDAWTFTTLDPDTQAPQVEGFEVPTDDQTDLGLFPYAFYASFDEDIYLIPETSAVIVLKKQDGSTVETFTSDDLSVEGSSVSINHYLILEPSTSYYFTFGAGLVEDEAGNDFLGFTDVNTWNFTTRSQAQEDLFVSSVLPSTGSTDISLTPTIRVNFNYELTLGQGIVRLKKASNDVVVKEWDFSTTSEYSIADGTYLTLTGAPTLEYSTEYYLEMENAQEGLNPVLFSFEDGYYAGWQDDFWTFTTLAPAFYATSFSPTNGATGVAAGTNLSITFNAAVNVGSGSITVHKVSDNTQVGSISNFNGSYMSIDGSTITFDFASNLPTGQELYVNVSSGYLRSMANGDDTWSGIQDNTTWRFTTLTPDVTAPTISVLSPSDNATGVSISSDLLVTFNESISAGSGSIVIKRLSDNQTVASVSIGGATINGSVLTINPSTDLDYSTEYYVDMSLGLVTDAALNQFAGLSGNPNWTFTTEAAPDTQAPTITTLSPADNATGVSISSDLLVTFNEPISPGSGSIIIKRLSNHQTVASVSIGGASINGSVLTINPSTDLDYSTEYYVDMSIGLVTDAALNQFAGQNGNPNWTFTTETAPDTQGPTISSFSPTADATNVDADGNLTITFSESVVAGTGNIQIQHYVNQEIIEAMAVGSGNVTISGSTVTINPTNTLPYNSKMYVFFPTGVLKDQAGNEYQLDEPILSKGWSFTTEVAPDETAPVISSFSPTADATNVDADGNLTITFSENVVAGTGNIQIQHYVNQEIIETMAVGSGNITIDGNTVTINPTNTLPYNSRMYVFFGTGTFKDQAGNEYELDGVISSKGWSFTTEGQDTQGPTFTTGSPANGSTGVGINETITLNFNESLTIPGNGATKWVILRSTDNTFSEGYVFGGSKATVSGTQVVITNPNLPYGKSIYFTIAEGVLADAAGNWISDINSSSTWSITTEAAPDNTAPTISSFSPSADATNVDADGNLTITFSENVVAGTGNIQIQHYVSQELIETMAVGSGNITISGNTVTINPTNTLPYNSKIYVIFLTGTFKDVAGNEYELDGVISSKGWSFTTEGAPDETAPTISSFSPTADATNVDADGNLTITFSESVVAGTGNIQIQHYVNQEIIETIAVGSGNVTINGNTVTINPTNTLPYNSRIYVIFLTGTFKDVAGNEYELDGVISTKGWSFTTEVQDTQGPTFNTGSPANGSTGVGINETITLNFNESLTIPGNGATKWVILKSTDNLFSEGYVFGGSNATVSGSQIVITNPNLPYSKTIYFVIYEGVLADAAGNWISDINSSTSWSITTEAAPDSQAPTVTTLSPANGAQNVAGTTNLTLTFDEAIQKGEIGKSIQIRQSSDDALLQNIPVGNSIVQISGNQAIIDPGTTIPLGSSVYVTIEAGTFKDLAGNAFAGILDKTSWAFATEATDQTSPVVSTYLPADGATGVELNAPLKLTFNETIKLSASTGMVKIFKQGGTLVQEVTIQSSNIQDYELTIPHTDFEFSTTYYVQIVSGVILDIAGNAFAGITTTTTWDFTTKADKQSQTITFESLSDKTYGDQAFSLSAQASSGLTVQFSSSNTNVVSISGTTASIVGAGEVTITASQSGNESFYAATSVGRSFVVNKAGQTITIQPIQNQVITAGPISVSAQVNTGLPLTYSVTGPASLSGTTINLSGQTGTVTVTVNQAGTANYQAANESITFSVTDPAKQDQSISFEVASSKVYGDAPFDLSATSSSGLPVSFSIVSGSASVAGTRLTLTGAGAVVIRATQEGNASINPAVSVQRTITVAKAKLTITAESKTMVVGEAMPSLTMNYAGFVNGDDTRAITAPSISTTATALSEAGTYPVTLSGGSALNYTISLFGGQLTITKATQGISIEAVSSKTFGDEAFELIATATSRLPVTFSAEGPVSLEGNLVTILGAGEVTVTVAQAGNGFFAASEPVSISFVIAKAVASITLSDLEQEADGTPKQPTVVTSPEGLEYILSFNSSGELPSVAGTYELAVTIVDENYEGTAGAEFVLTSDALGFESAIEIAVYPNPATDYLEVKSGKSEVVRIYSLDGLEVRTTSTNQRIEVGSLPEGVYLVRVKSAVIRIRKN